MDLYSIFILTADGVICIVEILIVKMLLLLVMLFTSEQNEHFLDLTDLQKCELQNQILIVETGDARCPY
jgi:hypothetical protein